MCLIFPLVKITHSILANVLWKFNNYKKQLLSKETSHPLEEKPCWASVNVMFSNPR